MFDEKEIISRIVKGDLQAFKLLVKQYERLVLFMINKIIKDKEDTEDLCQEVFIKIYKNLPAFKFQSKLSTWIAQIAYTTALNYLKKHSKGRKESIENIENIFQADDNPLHLLTNKDISTYLNLLIDKLPEQYKTVLTLYHINEFSYQEIEQITGMPEGTVKNYLFRARKLLKEKLEIYLKNEIAWRS